MPQAEALFHLQQIDLRLLRNQKRLKEIADALTNRAAIDAAQTQVERTQDKLKPLHARQQNLELEIQSNSQKAKSTEDRLYSGNVKNPKELQDMQHEIGSLKKRNDELEDLLLEQMVTVEDAEAELDAFKADLEHVTAEWESQHSDLLQEQAQLETDSQSALEARKQALQKVEPPSLQLYNEMKGKKANQPIAALQGQSCSVCGMEQTLTIQQDVRHGQGLVTCSNCGRILANISM